MAKLQKAFISANQIGKSDIDWSRLRIYCSQIKRAMDLYDLAHPKETLREILIRLEIIGELPWLN